MVKLEKKFVRNFRLRKTTKLPNQVLPRVHIDNQLLSIYHEKDREYRAIKNNYENDKARIWTDMIEWIDPSVHEKVRLQETKYLTLQETSDTLGLHNLLSDKVLCGGTGGVDSFRKLRQQRHSLNTYVRSQNE
jgi:hypothetical protein